MTTMRVVQVSRPNGPLEIVERPVPEPVAGSVRIRVQACGICHSDSFTKEGTFPGIQYPRVPGHEVAGVIDAVGPGVAGWRPGHDERQGALSSRSDDRSLTASESIGAGADRRALDDV